MAQGAVNRLKLVGAEALIAAVLITVVTILSANILQNRTSKGVTILSSGIRQVKDDRSLARLRQGFAGQAVAAQYAAERWQTVNMRVTAYCLCKKCCGPLAQGITASGHKIGPGETFVAADRRYPFGTELIIPGYNNNKAVKILDRGGAIRGDHIDIFFASHKHALAWGVKTLDIQVRSD